MAKDYKIYISHFYLGNISPKRYENLWEMKKAA